MCGPKQTEQPVNRAKYPVEQAHLAVETEAKPEVPGTNPIPPQRDPLINPTAEQSAGVNTKNLEI